MGWVDGFADIVGVGVDAHLAVNDPELYAATRRRSTIDMGDRMVYSPTEHELEQGGTSYVVPVARSSSRRDSRERRRIDLGLAPDPLGKSDPPGALPPMMGLPASVGGVPTPVVIIGAVAALFVLGPRLKKVF